MKYWFSEKTGFRIVLYIWHDNREIEVLVNGKEAQTFFGLN
jgi:hypothetical protein